MNGSQSTVHSAPPPLVKVHGSHREMGRQIGEFAKSQIRHSLENARALIQSTYSVLELNWDGANIQVSHRYLQPC